MAALTRASFRSKHPIFNIKMDALRPGVDCVKTYGNPIYDFGIEFNGIFFYVSPKEAVEAFILTSDEYVWRGVLYRRSLYHNVNRSIPVEFDLAVIQESSRSKKIERNNAVVTPIVSITSGDILSLINEKMKGIFTVEKSHSEEKISEILEEESDRESKSEKGEDSSSDESDDDPPEREGVILLRKLYNLASENMHPDELDALKECMELDECIHDTLSDYDQYSEELHRLLLQEEKEVEMFPKVALYYYFMVHVFKTHTNRALKWLLTFLCDRFKIRKQVIRDHVLMDNIVPEEYTIETEEGTKSIFEEITFTVLGQERSRLDEESDVESIIEETSEEKKIRQNILENYQNALGKFQEASERHLEDISKIGVFEIEDVIPRKERPQELRLLNYSFKVVEMVRGIG